MHVSNSAHNNALLRRRQRSVDGRKAYRLPAQAPRLNLSFVTEYTPLTRRVHVREQSDVKTNGTHHQMTRNRLPMGWNTPNKLLRNQKCNLPRKMLAVMVEATADAMQNHTEHPATTLTQPALMTLKSYDASSGSVKGWHQRDRNEFIGSGVPYCGRGRLFVTY